jgi:DNA-binding NarL/FixJ family response regulator
MGTNGAPPAPEPSAVRVLDTAQLLEDAVAAELTHRLGAGGPDAPACLLVGEEHDRIAACVAEHPDAVVVALVGDAGRRVATAALDAGAHGVALRDAPAWALARVIEAAVAGFVVVPARSRQALRRPVFTPRQKQVLSLLVLGMSNADIATRLFISEATVKMHLSAIFALLGVRSRKEAVDLILDRRNGLGTGILEIAETSTLQEGYGRPAVE